MPDLSVTYQRYLNADTVKLIGPKIFTIKGVSQEELGRDDGPKELKNVARFEEDPRGVVLNRTNYDILTELFGSPDTDKWLGGKIELFYDSSVRFGNKRGGIGVRAPRG